MSDEPRQSFLANKVSGGDGTIFSISPIVLIVSKGGGDFPVQFPFYALTIDSAAQHFDEWIQRDMYEKETKKLLSFVAARGVGAFHDLALRTTKDADIFVTEARICAESLPTLSDNELATAYAKFVERYITLYTPGTITFLYEDILSEKLFSSLRARYSDAAAIIRQVLESGYQHYSAQSEKALLEIQKSAGSERQEKISAFLKSYYFITTNYARLHIPDEASVEEMAKHIPAHEERSAQVLEPHFALTTEEKQIVALLRATDVIHDQRKRLSTAGCYSILHFLEEAVRRTGTELFLVERLFWTEFADFFKNPSSFLEKLSKREQGSIVFHDGRIEYLDYCAVSELVDPVDKTYEIKGTPASPGKISGKVRIVLGSKDFHAFEKGEILVTEMTRPDFLPIIRIASAVLTDEGGLTSHAAIIARELKKPCIIGTKIATIVLKDGDFIEVDAEKGIVRKL